MPCTRPLKMQRVDGVVRVVPSSSATHVDARPDTWFRVPCGQCIDCRLRRTREWAIRATHEAQVHKQNCFVTLTYDDENLPKNLSVDVKVWQSFAKRMRKKIGSFRFLHCGEYGDKSLRPHYHACIFGQDFRGDRKFWKRTEHGNALFVSEKLKELWPYGFTTIGELTFDSAAYVASYCTKKVTGARAKDAYRRTNPVTGESWMVKPEYATMSRRPGLGFEWFKKYKEDVYPDDFVVAKGRKFAVPRYYDGLLESSSPQLFEEVRRTRRERMREEESPERLRTIEKVHEHNYEVYNGKLEKEPIGDVFADYVDRLRKSCERDSAEYIERG